MLKSDKEVEELKANWLSDPCWDLWDTEGFEGHKEELLNFQREQEHIWENERYMKEKAINEKADSLGVRGIYRLILKQETLLKRHEKAIEALSDGESLKAYKILNGHED